MNPFEKLNDSIQENNQKLTRREVIASQVYSSLLAQVYAGLMTSKGKQEMDGKTLDIALQAAFVAADAFLIHANSLRNAPASTSAL